MTQYPEAVLARELDLRYAGVALVTDADSGEAPGDGVTQEEVFASFDRHLDRLRHLLVAALTLA
jgi:5'-methylthioadenosine phosphorylase